MKPKKNTPARERQPPVPAIGADDDALDDDLDELEDDEIDDEDDIDGEEEGDDEELLAAVPVAAAPVGEGDEDEEPLGHYPADIAEFLSTCGWCGTPLAGKQRQLAYGIKARIKLDRCTHAAKILEFYLERTDQSFLAAVTQKGSEALKAGWDLIVHVCTQECGRKCQRVLKGDTRFGTVKQLE